MSEEKKEILPPQPEEAAAPQTEKSPEKESRPLSKGQQQRRQQSALRYITILFAAAFVLLLFTSMMERRQFEAMQQENQEQIDDLQQDSITAVNSLNKLYKENDKLKEQVAELEEQLQQAVQKHQSEKTTLTQSNEAKAKSIQAMDWFWQIDEAYVRGRYSLCRSLIQNLESAGLVDFLPKESTTANDRFSPYDRFQEIYQALY